MVKGLDRGHDVTVDNHLYHKVAADTAAHADKLVVGLGLENGAVGNEIRASARTAAEGVVFFGGRRGAGHLAREEALAYVATTVVDVAVEGAELTGAEQVGDRNAAGSHHFAGGVAASAALGVGVGGTHGESVVGAVANRRQVLGKTATHRVVAVGAELVVLLNLRGKAVGVDAANLRKPLDGVGLHDPSGLDLVYHAVAPDIVGLAAQARGLVEDAPAVVGHVHGPVGAAVVDVAVTGHVGLVNKALALAAHDDAAGSREAGKAGTGHVGAGQVGLGVVGEGADEVDVGAREGAHVPQVGAHLDGHLHAVAGVVQGALGVGVGLLAEVLEHGRVVLEAAHRHDNAVHRMDVVALAVVLNHHADDRLGVAILDELDHRRIAPEGDALLIQHRLVNELIELALPTTTIQEGTGALAALELGKFGEGYDNQIVGGCTVVEHPLIVGREAVHKALDNLVRLVGIEAAEILIVCDAGLAVGRVGAQAQLAGVTGVAALVVERGLFGQKNVGAGLGCRQGGGGTGKAKARHHNVVLGVPNNLGAGLVGKGGGSRHAARSRNRCNFEHIAT